LSRSFGQRGQKEKVLQKVQGWQTLQEMPGEVGAISDFGFLISDSTQTMNCPPRHSAATAHKADELRSRLPTRFHPDDELRSRLLQSR
jgi:hypothetical protein